MRRPQHPHSPFGLNMTPMIDVVFQLLIFFVCTVEFQKQEELLAAKVPMPLREAGAARSPVELDLGRIEIEVRPDALAVAFQGRSQEFADPSADETLVRLGQELAQWARLESKTPLRIACRPDVPTGTLLRVYDACIQAGMSDVAIVNNP